MPPPCAPLLPRSYDDADYEKYKENGAWQNIFLPRAAGFTASSGWDPVSGLGSIQYDKLSSLFPVSTATSEGTGCLGCDYYDENSLVDSAQYFHESHSVPSPPPDGSYGG